MTFDELQQLVNKAIASSDQPSASRMARGMDLLTRHLADPRKRVICGQIEGDKVLYRVRSAENLDRSDAKWYLVDPGPMRDTVPAELTHCTCVDNRYSEHVCKHIYAIRMLRRLM